METTNPKSSCCGADVRAEGDVTKFYVCSKCDKACDAIEAYTADVKLPDNSKDRFEEEAINKIQLTAPRDEGGEKK